LKRLNFFFLDFARAFEKTHKAAQQQGRMSEEVRV